MKPSITKSVTEISLGKNFYWSVHIRRNSSENVSVTPLTMKIRAKKRLILMTITQQGKILTDYHKFYIMCTFICILWAWVNMKI